MAMGTVSVGSFNLPIRGPWVVATVYNNGDFVGGSDGNLYISICVDAYISTSDDNPVTGVNKLTYWATAVLGLTADQIASLVGTSGTAPSGTNKLVDNADLRLKKSIATLTDAAEVTPDFATSNNHSLLCTGAVGASRTLKNPSGLSVGQRGVIYLIQSTAGGNDVVFDTYYKFAGGAPPTITVTGNAVDRMAYVVRSTTFIDCDFAADIK